ncbi:MAG: class I SAM-dependent methyltransferase [Anaerolineae bacterium]|nr:class I SAM-dependent methyltransferase [Anaerolineae bacterium]
MVALNIGCGKRPIPGAFGVDLVALAGVQVVANFEGCPLPFASHSVQRIYTYHVLEHIRDLNALMTELHRVLAPGGELWVEVPYYACVGAFGDPTHVRFFAYHTFRFWTADTDQANWFSRARFQITRRKLVFGRVHRLLGIGWLANQFPDVYENFFAFWFPARMLTVTLRAEKAPPA